ncbi:proline-tRNA ligase [Phytophthora nicotianae P10297]|uniref:proline--tRNA ligase n=1 Tax=Phytophthora nicotianae P10297 TaxID=1317064 RepID=W2Y2R2_PHYNI|nr:proline-tRNA ligase [Phytophthora nicotianae P10297]
MATLDKSVADVEVAAALTSLSIAYEKHEHRELPTTEDVIAELSHLPGLSTKNLVFKDKKEGLFLVTAAPTTVVDTKKLGARLHAAGIGGKKWNLRFATEDVLANTLKVTKGSVSPLCVMHDAKNEVRFVLDKALLDTTQVNCHPLRNDQTYSIKSDDLLKFVKHYNHEPIVVDFAAQTEEPSAATEKTKAPKAKKEEKKKPVEQKANEGMSVTKKENFADWYTDAITKSGMIDYYDVSGCYILRPYSYEIWERVQQFLDRNLKAIGVKNCYFPMFVTKEKLEKEKDHLEGFAPEVAWVTKSGNSDLKDPIAIRPTSETIMYPAFKNWIRSHRDLPMKLNQWNNVVRWEFKNPTPFLRTREFLWQEGHTAHATKAEADEEVRAVLDFYAACYEELLAVPMIKGVKTEKEKFAGADYTTTIEGFIPATGRGIQAATSHMLGQNFGKMFGITAEYEDGKKLIPWQNSWGFTTRSLGVMIMVHGDDKGLVLPPRVAPTQVIVVPIPFKNQDEVEEIFAKADEIVAKLSAAGVRIEADKRRVYTPGWKYNHWELKGVPLRFEVGPKDIAKKQMRVVRRDNGAKEDIPEAELATRIPALLEQIQQEMLERATAQRDSHIREVTDWKDFVPSLQDGCMALTPFCDEIEWEEIVKTKSREESLALMGLEDEAENTATSAAAKTLCIPYKKNDESPVTADTKCFISGKPAKCWVLWGRSY